MGISSPLATGGAGTTFEFQVAASYLAALLLNGPAKGAVTGACVEVQLQQRGRGAPLDDIIVTVETPSGRARCDLQVKRTFAFAVSNDDFAPVMRDSWATFQQPAMRSPRSRFGVAFAATSPKLRADLARVPVWARTSSSAEDFLGRIGVEGFSSKPMRKLVDTVRTHLEQQSYAGTSVTDQSLWEFFQRFAILDFDLTLDASGDRLATIEALRRLVPSGSVADADALYGRLYGIAAETAQTGGGFTEPTLRARLLSEPIELRGALSCERDIERLEEHTDRVLRSIRTTIGDARLDRTEIVNEVVAGAERGGLVMVVGAAGAGKSAVLRSAAETLRDNGPVIALSNERLAGVSGWDGLAALLNLDRRLGELVPSLSGGARPLLVIDGVDRVSEPGARLAVNDIIRAASEFGGGSAASWGIIVTTRVDQVNSVRSWLHAPAGQETVVEVPELGLDDLRALVEHLPHLRWVALSERTGPVLRNPFFLRTLEQARATDPAPGDVITEATVQRVWWEAIVGRDGDRARQEVMIQLGEQALERRGSRLSPRGTDPGVLAGLERDGVLRREADTDSYWFEHDVLEEWSMARALARHEATLFAYLQSLGHPYWARGPMQLLAAFRLEAPDGATRWRALLADAEQIGSDDALGRERWVEAVITAPLRSGLRLRDLLPVIGDAYLANDGRHLATFLRALRTEAIVPNPVFAGRLDVSAVVQLTAEERMAAALEYALPRPGIWEPALQWLAPRAPDLPGRARDEMSRVMLMWQQARYPKPGPPFRRELAEAALAWRSVLSDASGSRVYVSHEHRKYFDRLREIVARSADVIPEHIRSFLHGLLQTEERSDLRKWLANSQQPQLARHAPGALVDFTLDVLVPDWRYPDGVSADEAARRHVEGLLASTSHDYELEVLRNDFEFIEPSHVRGPFLLLLQQSESEGLRLLHTLTNRATAAYVRERALEGAVDTPVVLELPSGRSSFRGDARVYQWFRPTVVAPYSIIAALMALELWMEEQIETGRDSVELFNIVLSGSECLGVVGACVAVSLAYPDQCLRASVPFMLAPLLWGYDIQRFVNDRRGAPAVANMIGVDDTLERITRSRDGRPQRGRELRDLVMRLLAFEDEALRDRVLASIRRFPEDLSPLTESQRADPNAVESFRNAMHYYAAFGDPANYRVVALPDGQRGIMYEAPQELRDRDAQEQAEHHAMQRYLSLDVWSQRTLECGAAAAGMSFDEALRLAREFHRPSDFHGGAQSDDVMDLMRLEAIVRTIVAGLAFAEGTVGAAGHLSWCVDVLAAASTATWTEERWTGILSAELASLAARGLMLLVRNGADDDAIRLAAFRCLRHGEHKVVDAVIEGARHAWESDPTFGRNVVAYELGCAAIPHRSHVPIGDSPGETETAIRERRRQLVESLEENVRLRRSPALIELEPRAPADAYNTWHLGRAFKAIPSERVVDSRDGEWALRVTDAALGWSMARCQTVRAQGADTQGQRIRVRSDTGALPESWAENLGEWLARLLGVLNDDSAERYVLAPLRDSWPVTASITSELLYAYTVQRLAVGTIDERDARRWRSIAEWVMPSAPLSSSRYTSIDRKEQEALSLLLHVRYNVSVLTSAWAAAPDFVDVYNRWVGVAGHTHWGVHNLLAFLEGPGTNLDPTRIVEWLAVAVERADDRERLWRDTSAGTRIANLIARVLAAQDQGAALEATTRARAANLLDELARAGNALASHLRDRV